MKRVLFFLALAAAGAATNQIGAEAGPLRVHIRAERFSFTPSQVKVDANKSVELVLSSEDTQHGFWIRKLGINQIIPARGKGELKVTLPPLKPGTYTFECSRACGAGHNMMRGTIKVE